MDEFVGCEIQVVGKLGVHMKSKISLVSASLIYFVLIIDLLIMGYNLPKNVWLTITTLVVVCGLILNWVIVRKAYLKPFKYPLIEKVLYFVAFGTLLPFMFVKEAFGVNDLDSIFVTLTENDLGKMSTIGIADFSNLFFRYGLLGLGLFASWLILFRSSKVFRYTATISALLMLPFHPLMVQIIEASFPNQAHNMVSLEEDFIEPNIISSPKIKKNMILVYLESVERTYKNLDVTKNEFEILGNYEDKNLSFRNVGQISGTHFTLGGLVATQCGIPYYTKGILDLRKKMKQNVDINVGINEVFPSITCLGDILSNDGYTASYINGSDLNVFSKGLFFENHGYERVFGINVLENYELEPMQNVWGLNDEYVFDKVKNEIKLLSEQDNPFLLSMLTISTHGPDAFLDTTCEKTGEEASLIPSAIKCSAEHVASLVQYVEDLGIADETMIVVMSDHLAMKNTVFDHLKSRNASRRNYFVVLNGENKKIITKPATAMDIFPTLLNLAGYELEKEGANFGRSLMSDSQTLVERLGLETTNQAFLKNTEVQRFVWR